MSYTLLIIGEKQTSALLEAINIRCRSSMIYKYGDFCDIQNELRLKIAVERNLPIFAYGMLNTVEERRLFVSRLQNRKVECALSMSEVLLNDFIEEPRLSEGFSLIADLDKVPNIKKYFSPTISLAEAKTATSQDKQPLSYGPQKSGIKIPRIPIIRSINMPTHENIQ